MAPQPIPIDLAVRLVDIALIPDADRVHGLSGWLVLSMFRKSGSRFSERTCDNK
jgi:hypothetical protein